MKYNPVIGLEVHLQTKTNSKMFCDCSTDYFGEKPNTKTCPVCLGLPGALPSVNEKALEHCLRLSLALHCKINKESKFDRKNYFFPDLPKGYQISQYDLPIGYEGWVEIDINGDSRRVRVTRVHQEEDTGKTINEGDELLLDFNKSGIPLVEIVTEPDFESKEEVTGFAKEVRRIVRYLGVSDADMEKGQMRFELNMSLREEGTSKLPDYKVEIKNIGSISVLEKVVDKEMTRQLKILESGKTPVQETRGLKDMTGDTVVQRTKEDSKDYRYFPEPDIPPLEFGDKQVDELQKSIPELPAEKRKRFQKEYKVEPDTAAVLVASMKRADWFERAAGSDTEFASEIAKWVIGELANLMREGKTSYKELKLKPEQLYVIAKQVFEKKISGTSGKQVLALCFETGQDPLEIIVEKKLAYIEDFGEIEKIAASVIKEHAGVVEDYRNKNENAIKFLVGQVMRTSKGRANPKTAEEILLKLIGS